MNPKSVIRKIIGDKYSKNNEEKSKLRSPCCGEHWVKRFDEWYCPNCNEER